MRLDIFLVENNIAKSRAKAKELILNSQIKVNGIVENKVSRAILSSDVVEVTGEMLRYVSRGGLKLEKAINDFNINLTNLTCADIGSSTGGFTDCMLQNGAFKVYAIDVGTDQLDEKLLSDKRVISMEKTNIRNIKEYNIIDEIDFISVDVSFISLSLVLDPIKYLLSDKGTAVLLIKPQFEVGPENLNKNGVVKNSKMHIRAINKIVDLSKQMGFYLYGLGYSPIKGPSGNIEYLLYLGNVCENVNNIKLDVPEVVSNANINL